MDNNQYQKQEPGPGQQSGLSAQTISIISYLTLIGWVIALVLNQQKKDPLASFHIRQVLGIMLLGFAVSIVGGMIPIIGWVISIFASILILVLWIIGFIGAIQGEYKQVPLLGDKFQEWFKAL